MNTIRYISRLLFVVTVFFALCCCERLDDINLIKDSDKETSDKIITDIVKVIEDRNTEKLIEMFSVKAKKSQNIEEQVKIFFEKFNDNNLTLEDNAGPIVYDNTESGNKSKKIINWYEVQGQSGKYTVFFISWTEDTADNDNIGLYTLRIIKEIDLEEQFIEHDKMEIAGIYYNPSDN